MNPNQYRLDEAQNQAIFEQEIKPDLFADAKPSGQPVAVIFGGQPGSGKSAAVAAAAHELESQGGAVRIVGDDLRGHHPHYARLMEHDDKTAASHTNHDTERWVDKAIDEGKAQRVNLVIEDTMRDSDKVASMMKGLRDEGYEVDARALAVNSRLSEQGILQQYETQKAVRGAGRMTSPEEHQAAYDGMPATLERIEQEKLADRVTVYRRGNEAIYSNELRDGQWACEPQARAAAEFERNRSMTLQERREYAQGYDTLSEQMSRPERQASPEELRNLETLRQQAKDELSAEVFRREPAEKAVQQHPELAPAYASMRAIEAKAQEDGLSEQQQAVVMGRVRENIASEIERGKVPSVQMVEEKQFTADHTTADHKVN